TGSDGESSRTATHDDSALAGRNMSHGFASTHAARGEQSATDSSGLRPDWAGLGRDVGGPAECSYGEQVEDEHEQDDRQRDQLPAVALGPGHLTSSPSCG